MHPGVSSPYLAHAGTWQPWPGNAAPPFPNHDCVNLPLPALDWDTLRNGLAKRSMCGHTRHTRTLRCAATLDGWQEEVAQLLRPLRPTSGEKQLQGAYEVIDQILPAAYAECPLGIIILYIARVLMCLREGDIECFVAHSSWISYELYKIPLTVIMGTDWPIFALLNSYDWTYPGIPPGRKAKLRQHPENLSLPVVETPFFAPQKEELKELTGGFRKKAAAPKRVAEFKELRSELARHRTPIREKAMLYALDFYSVILGFEEPGSKWPRCKKIADDFASKAPPRNPAPFLDAPFLSFLEGCVVDEKMDIAERLTCGKLRLCAQASIRHDDLHNTPLSGTEWCRLRGSSAVVIVLKGQVVVLERLRSGEKIGSLEGVGLTGERFGAEVLLRQGPSGEAEFVPELWQDVVMFLQELRDEGLAKVPTDEKTDYLAKEKEAELPEISDCVEPAEKSDEEFGKIAAEDPAEDSEDSDASVEKHDMEVLDCLVTCGSRTKKVHRPAAGVANNPLQGNIPWCNASGKSFTILPLFEALPGDVSLCMRIGTMWGMSLAECQRLHLVSTRWLKRSGALPHPERPGVPRQGVSWREREMSHSRSATAFSRAAVEFDVHESDFLILTMDRISTFEAMAFRFPKEADFEDYLKRAVRPGGAYRDEDDNVVGYDKRSPEPWDLYKSSEDCGCLRKLWHMAAQVAKKELESLASGQDESSTPKMNSVLSNELETKATDSGMPTPASDKERPSLHTLGKAEQTKANRKASWTTRALGCKVQTVAMERLQAKLAACLFRLKVLGPAQESPFFTPFDVPPKMTWGEFHSTKRQRSSELIERVKRMSDLLGGQEMAKAIWKKTQKEIDAGSMGPPQTWDEIDELFKGDFQVVPSFGLEQGVDDSGLPKFRRIDDHTAAGNNLVAHRTQKVPMAMVDQVGLMVKSL
eukprot:symbB.v1.2.002716.t1/scaffold148.1/size298184/5